MIRKEPALWEQSHSDIREFYSLVLYPLISTGYPGEESQLSIIISDYEKQMYAYKYEYIT